MKWYKHLAKSIDNPFIRQLMYEFGADAYLVFFGTLEIYADNFAPSEHWQLCVKARYLRDKLLLSSSKLQKILTKISQNPDTENKWEVSFNNDEVVIFIPKFKKIVDNYTKDNNPKTCKQLASDQQETFQAIRIKNKEVEEERDIKADTIETSPVENSQKDAFLEELNKTYKKVLLLYPNFKAQLFYQTFHKKNPQAIIHTFNRLIEQNEKGFTITNPWAYCEKIIINENMNCNASDSEKINNEYKKNDLSSLSGIFQKIQTQGV